MPEEKKSRYTPAQARAAAKYQRERVENITVRVPRGDRQRLADHAAGEGESLNAFIRRAVEETIARDDSKKAAGGASGDVSKNQK